MNLPEMSDQQIAAMLREACDAAVEAHLVGIREELRQVNEALVGNGYGMHSGLVETVGELAERMSEVEDWRTQIRWGYAAGKTVVTAVVSALTSAGSMVGLLHLSGAL